ncbi:oxygen-independent coproporphyrinogen-3 oxidase [Ruminobacter amylophilus]|jgi:oxygen-independent coproporphyrinogen-3 oxidase|uniref:Heme chaperone HemW n=1 Tax=Ruminobacter amylophilus TaxID=867 RepID=A0A662ZLI8_9GAMM|nr:radical SAM family heme chaperone HemW [Ruminobacter amylophilus]SFP52192.1 oxygen-independent coproporphyrinogen-3 oxidase [Ruminobacter amylophilus]
MIIPKLGLYIHIPFCIRKCPYCDFFSEKISSKEIVDKYVEALIHELSLYSELTSNRLVETIYIGGGTPTLFSPKKIDQILNAVNKFFTISADAEISMEANPGTVSSDDIRNYREIGINRLSIGIQSLNDKFLKILHRIHTRKEAIKVAETVSKYYDNFNLDLMHSLPGQTYADAINDLKELISLNPRHISWYQLTIEEGTAYAESIPSLPDEDVIDSIYIEGYDLLKSSGYHHYEVSAFAQKEYQCKHNVNYWTFGDYLGAGAGAHSKLTINNKIRRQSRIENTCTYINNLLENQPQEIYLSNEIIPEQNIPFEYFLNRLRLFTPLSINEYENYTGLSFNNIRYLFEKYSEDNLVTIEKDKITITEKGQLFINQMLEDFL